MSGQSELHSLCICRLFILFKFYNVRGGSFFRFKPLFCALVAGARTRRLASTWPWVLLSRSLSMILSLPPLIMRAFLYFCCSASSVFIILCLITAKVVWLLCHSLRGIQIFTRK